MGNEQESLSTSDMQKTLFRKVHYTFNRFSKIFDPVLCDNGNETDTLLIIIPIFITDCGCMIYSPEFFSNFMRDMVFRLYIGIILPTIYYL